jgi:hypothetical protein
VLIVIALVLGLLLIPDTASAWGPISHLAHGSEALKNITILGAGLQQLLTRYPMEYLYGCVGADITLAKKYTRAMQAHCHSWEVGWRILDAAESDAQRAFAYGYLSHLAADVYSHNHFVPTQLVVSFSARTLRHVYWEARFDSMQNPDYRGIVRDLRRQEFPECDALVKRVVARTIFSFNTNKRIFDSVLAFHDWDNWHRIMQRVSTQSRYLLASSVVPKYNTACHRNIMDLLQHGKMADCQAADPTGLDAITLAKEVRGSLKTLARRRRLTPPMHQLLEDLDQRLDLNAPHAVDAGIGLALA